MRQSSSFDIFEKLYLAAVVIMIATVIVADCIAGENAMMPIWACIIVVATLFFMVIVKIIESSMRGGNKITLKRALWVILGIVICFPLLLSVVTGETIMPEWLVWVHMVAFLVYGYSNVFMN